MHGADDVMSVLSSVRSLLNRWTPSYFGNNNNQQKNSSSPAHRERNNLFDFVWSCLINSIRSPFLHPPTGPGPFYSHEDTEVVRLKAVGLIGWRLKRWTKVDCQQNPVLSWWKHKPGTHLLRSQNLLKQNDKSPNSETAPVPYQPIPDSFLFRDRIFGQLPPSLRCPLHAAQHWRLGEPPTKIGSGTWQTWAKLLKLWMKKES